MIEVDEKTLAAIRSIVDYTYEDEEKHFKESGQIEKAWHIFNDIEVVAAWLAKNKK